MSMQAHSKKRVCYYYDSKYKVFINNTEPAYQKYPFMPPILFIKKNSNARKPFCI